MAADGEGFWVQFREQFSCVLPPVTSHAVPQRCYHFGQEVGQWAPKATCASLCCFVFNISGRAAYLFGGVIWRSVWGRGLDYPPQTDPGGRGSSGRQAAAQQLLCAQWPLLFSSPSYRHWWQQQVPIGRGPSLHRQKSHLVRGAMLSNCHSKPLKMGLQQHTVKDYTEGTSIHMALVQIYQ